MGEGNKMTKKTIAPIIVLFGLIIACAIIWLPKQNNEKIQPTKDTSKTEVDAAVVETTDNSQENSLQPPKTEGNESSSQNNDMLVIGDKTNHNIITTISSIEILNPETLQVTIPAFYKKLEIPGVNYNVYAYMDKKGYVQCRVYGTKWIMENNIKKTSMTGFYKHNIELLNNNVSITDSGDKEPVTDNKKDAITPNRQEQNDILLPDFYLQLRQNLYICCNNEEQTGYRTWCLVNDDYMLFPCDSEGNVASGSIPVCYNEEVYSLVDPTQDTGNDYIIRYPGIITEKIVMPVY